MNSQVVVANPQRPGGYRELLGISIPLILSTSTLSLMQLMDRIFLSWYSSDALAACIPAGAASWCLMSLFVGTASYSSTFVSQYDGAGHPERIGAAVWQGVYFALFSAMLLVFGYWLSEPLFKLAGHAPEVQEQEVLYFSILILGGGGVVLSAALSAFYSGRGKTWIVMWVDVCGMLINGVLDYMMIFGKWGCPEWGIWGAGLATIIAPWIMSAIYFGLLFLPENRDHYGTLKNWRFESDLFKRLIRYGVPSGLQWTVDVVAFTVFVLLIGRIGAAELAASNVAFSINHLLFMPMIGLSMGASVLVGRYVGACQTHFASRTVSNAYWITLSYMTAFAVVLVLWPDLFLSLFGPRDQRESFQAVAELGRHLLYFVAAYSLLDASNIVFISALKGAGDTRYVLLIIMVVALAVLVIPSYVACVIMGRGIYVAWTILTLYVSVLGIAFYGRYRAGYWKSMRVIEHMPTPGVEIAEGPVVETA